MKLLNIFKKKPKNKFTINGIMLCECGRVIISNSDEVPDDFKNGIIKCEYCDKEYDGKKCFEMRAENKSLMFPKVFLIPPIISKD